MSANKTILICRCAERGWVKVDDVSQDEAVVVDDLCKAAAGRDPRLAGPFTEIHACHPRAVRALLDFAGYPLPESVTIHNHRKPAPLPPAPPLKGTPAWYPVIDYERCTACGQCHDFCLFGVYAKDEDGQVRVIQPESCKNNCPACARICPEAAIMFPKIAEAPINGAEITDESALRSQIKVNVDEILGDDVYAALNARKQKRKALLNRKKIEQALEERRKCSGEHE